MNDRHPARLLFADETPSQVKRLISGVVEHLNLEQVTRIVDLTGRSDDTLGDVQLVEQWQLDRDNRITRTIEILRRRTAAPKDDHEGGMVQTVKRQTEQRYAVNYHYREP